MPCVHVIIVIASLCVVSMDKKVIQVYDNLLILLLEGRVTGAP